MNIRRNKHTNTHWHSFGHREKDTVILSFACSIHLSLSISTIILHRTHSKRTPIHTMMKKNWNINSVNERLVCHKYLGKSFTSEYPHSNVALVSFTRYCYCYYDHHYFWNVRVFVFVCVCTWSKVFPYNIAPVHWIHSILILSSFLFPSFHSFPFIFLFYFASFSVSVFFIIVPKRQQRRQSPSFDSLRTYKMLWQIK